VGGGDLDGVPEGLRASGGTVWGRVAVREGLEERRLADLWGIVELVVAGGPEPGLVGDAALDETRPGVPRLTY
jgi:hypothetical protein